MVRPLLRTVLPFCFILSTSSLVAASRSEVINAAGACVSEPPYDATVGVPTGHKFYGVNQSHAYCHLVMSTDWQVSDLKYVGFTGLGNGSTVEARLCVHSGALSATCGPVRTLSGKDTFNIVEPPSPLPKGARGAYVYFSFVEGLTGLTMLEPYWSK
jgi:hypothetical protein